MVVSCSLSIVSLFGMLHIISLDLGWTDNKQNENDIFLSAAEGGSCWENSVQRITTRQNRIIKQKTKQKLYNGLIRFFFFVSWSDFFRVGCIIIPNTRINKHGVICFHENGMVDLAIIFNAKMVSTITCPLHYHRLLLWATMAINILWYVGDIGKMMMMMMMMLQLIWIPFGGFFRIHWLHLMSVYSLQLA